MLPHQRHPRGNAARAHVHGPRLPRAQGLRVVPLPEPGAAGDGHQVRRRGAPPRACRYNMGQPLLAARRLLAGRVLVGHRLLRALEGAALRRAPLLRARAGQPRRGGGDVRVYGVSDRRAPTRGAPDACASSTSTGASCWRKEQRRHAGKANTSAVAGRRRAAQELLQRRRSGARRAGRGAAATGGARPVAQPVLLREDARTSRCRPRAAGRGDAGPTGAGASMRVTARRLARAVGWTPPRRRSERGGCSRTTSSICCPARRSTSSGTAPCPGQGDVDPRHVLGNFCGGMTIDRHANW